MAQTTRATKPTRATKAPGKARPLHMVKLLVGIDSLEAYEASVRQRLENAGEVVHVTRMVPVRRDEVIGNSLFWVIRGNIQCRQRVDAIEPFRDEEGVRRCRLVLDPLVVPVEWKRKKAFQGWRYLKGTPPADLPEGAVGLPGDLRRELLELGLM